MVKSIKTSFLALALLAVAIAIPVSSGPKIAVFIKGGLSDSKKIRVAEATVAFLRRRKLISVAVIQ